MATSILQERTRITSRNDLSFTGRAADGYGHIINWAPVRVPTQLNQWGIEYRLGEAMAAEVVSLHSANESEAYHAIQFALNAQSWKTGGAGAESGFAAAIAALAVVGMRALQAGDVQFVPDAADVADVAEVDHG